MQTHTHARTHASREIERVGHNIHLHVGTRGSSCLCYSENEDTGYKVMTGRLLALVNIFLHWIKIASQWHLPVLAALECKRVKKKICTQKHPPVCGHTLPCGLCQRVVDRFHGKHYLWHLLLETGLPAVARSNLLLHSYYYSHSEGNE